NGPLPPGIAALTSMRSQATPITNEERRARIERARRLMADTSLDAIVLAGGTSLTYFTGIRWGNSERLFAVVLPAKGDAFCVSATPVTAGCRMIKDSHEIKLMRLASQVTLKAYEAVFHAMTEGMTQNQVGNLLDGAYSRLGFAGFASVQVGEYTALPHGSIQP